LGYASPRSRSAKAWIFPCMGKVSSNPRWV
jgi:hypothetical protein